MLGKKSNFYQKIFIGIILVLFLGSFPNNLLLQSSNANEANNRVSSVSSLVEDRANYEQLIQQGKEHYLNGDFTTAITIWQQAKDIEGQDKLERVVILNYLSLAYLKQGELLEAEQLITKSLETLEQLELKNISVLAQTLNTKGSLQLAQGKPRKAILTWQEATQLYRQNEDSTGEIGSLINQAQAMQELGLYVRAEKKLAEVKAILSQQTETDIKISGLSKLGNIQRLIGNLTESEVTLKESLKLARSLNSNAQISASLLDLGNTATVKKDYQTALDYYQQAISALPRRGAIAIKASAATKLKAQLNQLQILIALQKYDRATALSKEIKTELDKLPVTRNNISDRLNYLSSLIQLDSSADSTEKISFARNILQQTETIADIKYRAITFGYLGKIYEQTQQWQRAEQHTKEGLSLANSLNAAEISYQLQWQLGRIYKAQGDIEKAILSYQQAFETLQLLRRDLVANTPDLQFSFQENIEPLYRELVDLLLTDSNNSSIDNTKLQQSRAIIESLQIAELENYFRSNCLAGQIVPVDNISQTNAAIIYPIILPDRIEVILSLPQQPLTRATTYILESEVNDVLQQFSSSIRKPFTAPEGKLLGKQVYSWLIEPLKDRLTESQIGTLVFVLDGELANIPMSTLHNGEQYLIEEYSIGLAPGLQLLDPKPLQQVKLKALVGGLSESRHGFTALENVAREIAEIDTQLPSEVLVNSQFTSTALQNQIANIPYPVVHLASHGQFSSDAEDTFILAWDKPIKVKELNSFLRQTQQSDRKAIELLVLSACETAAGDKKAALGLAGVAIQAGARSTLATLWTVSDEATTEFMSQFYRLLAQGNLSKAEALRQAQLTLLKDPNYDTPYLWAAFVLLGNWL